MHRFLGQLKTSLSDSEWIEIIYEAMQSRSDESFLDNALVYSLAQSDDTDAHLHLMALQDRWNQPFVYLPKIGVLDFGGCTVDNTVCLDVLHRSLTHLLGKDQMMV
jgi:hypothetical protein